MKKIIIKSDYNIEKFLFQYEKDLKQIYRSLINENLIDLIDIVDIESLTIIEKRNKNIIECLKSEKIGIALMAGGVCDDNVTFFRAIDGVQYRIANGECYEETSENFHDYKTIENLIKIGSMEFVIESSYCILLYLKNGELNIELVEIELNGDIYKCKKIKDSGDIGNIINKYIINNIK